MSDNTSPALTPEHHSGSAGSVFLILLVVLGSCALKFNYFFPHFCTIGSFDEACHVQRGLDFLKSGYFPLIVDRPVIGMFYAPIVIMVKDSPWWLLQACIVGRCLLFVLLWSSTIFLAYQTRNRVKPLITCSFLLVLPVISTLTSNACDALFATLSGIAFALLLGYLENSKRIYLILACAICGLSSLIRTEGLVMVAVLLLVEWVHASPSKPTLKARLSRGLLCLSCFSVAILYAVALNGAARSNVRTLGSVTYAAFEQGHVILIDPKTKLNPWTEAMLLCRRTYGEPKSNDYSWMRAVAKDSSIFPLARWKTLQALPGYFFDIYGGPLSIAFACLTLRGWLALLLQKQYDKVLLYLAWPACCIFAYTLLCIRPELVAMFFYCMLPLMATAADSLGQAKRKELIGWVVVSAAIALISSIHSAVGLGAGVVLLFSSLILAGQFIESRTKYRVAHWSASIILAVLLLAQTVVPEIKEHYAKLAQPELVHQGKTKESLFSFGRTPGSDPEEKAILYLERNYNLNSIVASYAPAIVYAAKLHYVPLYEPTSEFPDHGDRRDIDRWLRKQHISALIVDTNLEQYDALTAKQIVENSAGLLVEDFSEPGIKIFRVKRR